MGNFAYLRRLLHALNEINNECKAISSLLNTDNPSVNVYCFGCYVVAIRCTIKIIIKGRVYMDEFILMSKQ